MDYNQPDFYHFTEDSLKLASVVIANMIMKKPLTLLDLCAGCGVIGIELANKLPSLQKVTLVEAQQEFIPYLQQNTLTLLRNNVESEIIPLKMGDLVGEDMYDLIVCNPPYFLPNSGRPAHDMRRQICRSFVLDSPTLLLEKIQKKLKDKAQAFIVLNRGHNWQNELALYQNVIQTIFQDSAIVVYSIGKIGLNQ
jgi:tRNA1Val (adenine37-N6)-methyltransferase